MVLNAPDPGKCAREIPAGTQQGPVFFVHGNDAGKTLRTEER